jgi:hypothetical protein
MGDDTLLWVLVAVWAMRNLADGNVQSTINTLIEPKSAPPGYRPDLPAPKNESRIETSQRVYDQVYNLAVHAGFPDPKLATAIALAESGGNPGAELHTDREWSVGLWQINMWAHPGHSREQLLDPEYNARTAVRISRSGTNWKPWSAYNSGRYLRFMERPKESPKPAPALWLSLPRANVTLERGKIYRANIRLKGAEATFGDAGDVADKLQEKAGPFRPLQVRKLQSDLYEAIGTFAGSKPRNVTWPDQVTAAWVQR